MTEQELESLRRIVDYCWRAEERHFANAKLVEGQDIDEADCDHIFLHLKRLDHYLNHEPAGDVISL